MVKTDCKHFPLDRPCGFHKEKGIQCTGCSFYTPLFSPAKKVRSLLMVKLDAMGDVLRTTFLLPGLKKKYPGSSITWVVAPESRSLLEHNPFIDRVWVFDKNVFSKIMGESFDEVINLDLSPVSLSLATMAPARVRTGFWLNSRRAVQCSNKYASRWLDMSAFDDKKKDNTQTYQHWMSKIVELPRADYEIHVPLLKDSVARAARFAKQHHLKGKTVVGINPGAGGRWTLKKWTDAGYLSLIERLAGRNMKVVLLGGPQEEALIAKLLKRSGRKAVSTGTNNTILDFFAFVDLCDLVITGDTMALHAALGLGKKAVAVFGPTSVHEIEMYGRGTKVVSPAACACCYRSSCTVKPTCMDMITKEAVWSAVEELLPRK